MSSLRAIELPTQRIELQASETEVYQRPRTVGPAVPAWCQRVDDTIAVIARFGYSPTPTILLVTAIVFGASLRTS